MAFTSGCMVLIPWDQYSNPAEDPHLTLVYFGKIADMDEELRVFYHELTDQVADAIIADPLAAKLTGSAVFSLDPEYNDGNKFAYVDLVDSVQLPRLRSKVEDYATGGHGFIPHMTRAYSTAWVPDYAKPTPLNKVEFVKVGLWLGDYRYEVEL